jgi:hypothetical protein
VLVGQLFSISVALDSLGLNDAVAVTLRVSTGMRVIGISPDGVNIPGCDLAQGTCWFPRIEAGGSKTVRIYATATDDRPGSIEVAVSAGGDANSANDTYVVPINASPAVDFRESRATPAPTLIRPGEDVEVRLSLVNTGTAMATNLRLRITLGAWFDFVSFTAPGGGPCVPDPVAANVRVCPLPDSPRFQQQLATLRVKSRPGTVALQPGQTTRGGMTFVAIADQPDLGGGSAIGANVDITPNIASLTVEIQPPGNPAPGASVDAQVVARNAGPDDVGQVAVEFNANGLFAAGAVPPASCTRVASGTRCELGTLRAGETRAITFRGTVGGEGSYLLSAMIQGATFSSAPSNTWVIVAVASAPPPPPSPPPAASGGGGGGGGAADPFWVLALLLSALGARVGRRSRRVVGEAAPG